jgi:hypothetical protein
MAKATLQSLLAKGASIVEAILGSGKNQDGTDFTVSASVAAGTNNIGDVDIASLPQSNTANVPEIATGAGDVLAVNAGRKRWAIQNVGTNPLFVRLGTGATITVFHFVLKGGTADSDGLGALLSDDMWTGVVSVAGASPKYTVTELT